MSRHKITVEVVTDNCPFIHDIVKNKRIKQATDPFSNISAKRKYKTKINVENQKPRIKCVEIEGKGTGMIATHNIPKGEFIMKEEPVIKIKDKNEWPPLVDQQFSRLSLEKKNAVMALHNAYPPIVINERKKSSRKLLGIFRTNSILVGHHCLMFLKICKFNHSCSANVEGIYKGNFYILLAKKDIMAEEELCISYLNKSDLRKSREYRQKELLETFNFLCSCELCKAETNNKYVKKSPASRISVQTGIKKEPDRKYQLWLVICVPLVCMLFTAVSYIYMYKN